MTKINQVKSTNDYQKFKILQGNRKLNSLHVKRLKESFKESYLFSPIVVNKNFEIIDGQHRFNAAKELNLDINYIVCPDYSLKEVQLLNTNSKNWKREDYLNAYCDLQYPEYIKFKNFMKKFPDFGILACESIISHSYDENEYKNNLKQGNSARIFQEGGLVIQDYEKSVEIAEKIMMIKPYYDGYNRTVFIRALISIFKIDYYCHSQLLNKLKTNPNSLQHCSNTTQYKLLIEDIYNYRSRDKVSLRY